MTDPSRSAEAHAAAAELRQQLGRVRRRLRVEEQFPDFSWPQIAVLTRLERHGPATVTALAKAEGVRSQSMGETVMPLKAAGHVVGAPDPADGRQTVLSITDSGRALLRTGRSAWEDWLTDAILQRLTPDEQHHLATTIGLIGRLVDP